MKLRLNITVDLDLTMLIKKFQKNTTQRVFLKVNAWVEKLR